MIPSADNVRTISDMREGARKLLRQVQKMYGPLYIFYRSKPQAVLLGIEEYKKLADLAEDSLDSLKAQELEREDKKKIKWVNYEAVKGSLK